MSKFKIDMLDIKDECQKGANVLEKRFLIIAYILFFVPFIFIVNFLFDTVTLERIQGLPVFSPFVFCSLGLFFAVKAYQIKKTHLTLSAIIANIVLFLFPFIYMLGGTVIFGV